MEDSLYRVEKIADGTWRIDEGGLDALYVVEGNDRAVLIDTGCGTGNLDALVRSLTHKPYDVYLTHGHVDHAGGARQFARVHVHPGDIELARSITREGRLSYAASVCGKEPENMMADGDFPVVEPLSDGDRVELGGRTLEVMATPGHTAGSVCFLDRDRRILFAGDTLQGLELIAAPGEDRKAVLTAWMKKVEELKALHSDYDQIAGGHGAVDDTNPDNLLALGRGILDGTILGQEEDIHIFRATFYHYGPVCLMMDEKPQIITKEEGNA